MKYVACHFIKWSIDFDYLWQVNSWSGSIEIGITNCNPDTLTLPLSATGLRDGTWVMSGTSILRDGHTASEEYGRDLDQLKEGDRVGVMLNQQGELHFYVNGRDQGVAASSLPSPAWAVVDLYGKCAQVSVYDPGSPVLGPVLGNRQTQNGQSLIWWFLCNTNSNTMFLTVTVFKAKRHFEFDPLC